MPDQELLKLLGPFPDKISLDAEILESSDCGGYTRQKVSYSVEAGDRVTAFVLVPKRLRGVTAAVYCHHQHAGIFTLGKSEVVGLGGDPDQNYAHELAERGYITFAPDAIAFEERNWSDESGRAQYHELVSRLVQGQTLLSKVLHDLSVGIDYLLSRDNVDPKRIGFIGHSYGGRMAIWGPAFDKRIRASVSNCGCVDFRRSIDKKLGVQAEFCVPGIMRWGDLEKVVRMIEPNALLISATDDDRWSAGALELFEASRDAFKRGSLQLEVYKGGHQFTKEMRLRAYVFLDDQLQS